MNALLTAASLALGFCIAFLVPTYGASAVLLCGVLAIAAGYLVSKAQGEGKFLLQIFVGGLVVRVLVGTVIFVFNLQDFFGGDAYTYDILGEMVRQTWQGGELFKNTLASRDVGWGMAYMVGVIYTLIGRNMLAVQLVNAVTGAATAPVIYLCAQHIFQNTRVSRLATFFVAFYPSLVLWSSQGLKDGPMVFLLALSILATLRLGERFNLKWVLVLGASLLGILSLRFYIFYMMLAAIGAAFLVGMSTTTAHSLMRQACIVAAIVLMLGSFGVLQTATTQMETYGSLESVQVARSDLAGTAKSGFGKDVDVSTTGGALSTIPIGMLYLLFAPFPWQLASLRQSITLPEMVVWWASFPLLVMGLWFTLKYRARQALPILIFTSMLTIAYSVFQGNVGTAYRQRSQLLIFYFIFAAVGYVLVQERKEDRKRQVELTKQRIAIAAATAQARRQQQREWEKIADRLSEKVGF